MSVSQALTYNDLIPTLENWWKFDDGNYNDSVGNLDAVNSGSTSTTDKEGNSNSAVQCNAVEDDQIEIADIMKGTDDKSFIFRGWFKPDTSEPSGTVEAPFGCGVNNNDGGFGIINFADGLGSNGEAFHHRTLVGRVVTPSGVSNWGTNWIHYTIIYNDPNFWIFKDDTLFLTETAETTLKDCSSDGFHICDEAERNHGFNGKVDDVAFYNYTVSNQSEAQEIAELLYNEGDLFDLLETEEPEPEPEELDLGALGAFDLSIQSNVLLLFVVTFLYLGVLVIGFQFKNFGFISFGFFLGIVLGFMLSSVHIFMTILMFMMNIFLFLRMGKNR
jgi:hypothetical protein